MDDGGKTALAIVGVIVVTVVGFFTIVELTNTVLSKNDELKKQAEYVKYLEGETGDLYDLKAASEEFVRTGCDNAFNQEPTAIGSDAYGNPVQVPNAGYDHELVAACLEMQSAGRG